MPSLAPDSRPLIPVLLDSARALGLEVSPDQAALCERFLELLLEANQRQNLTAITDPEEAAVKHFIDSLTCQLASPIEPSMQVVDIGTGAGFPGIPLAICHPQTKFCLVDSSLKRTRFLADATQHLALLNVRVVRARAEDLGRDEQYREQFDLAVTRAVASLAVAAEYCLPLVKIGGSALVQKGPEGEGEVALSTEIITELGGEIRDPISLELPGGYGRRVLVVIAKISKTPGRFPRRTGAAAKQQRHRPSP